MQNLAAADAAINDWNTNTTSASGGRFRRSAGRESRWRAILKLRPSRSWTPLLTAPYPDHVSGHLGLDGSHTGVLRMFFGDAPAGGYQITSFFVNPGGDATRPFTSFNQALDELVEARIWAGLHFRTADVQGRQLGANVANFAAANYFQRVGN